MVTFLVPQSFSFKHRVIEPIAKCSLRVNWTCLNVTRNNALYFRNPEHPVHSVKNSPFSNRLN